MSRLVWLSLLVACGSEPATPDPSCDGSGDELTLLARSLRFGRQVDGVAVGFDLDGDVTADGGDGGCGVGDWTAPDGTPGIDNALAALLPVLELTEAAALEPLIQDSIQNGALLLLTAVTEVDDPADDACVDVQVLKAVGEPMVGNDGWLLPNQTLALDPASDGDVAAGSLTAGALTAGPIPRVALPVQVLDFDATVEIFDAWMRLTPGDDGVWRGFLAGGISMQALKDIATLQNIAPEVFEVVNPVLERLADLVPDEDGQCTQLSVVLEVEAVPAFTWDG